MARRDLANDATLLDFVSDLTPGPLAHRAGGIGRRLTGQGDNLALLFRSDLPWLARPGRIGQALGERQIVRGDRLEERGRAARSCGLPRTR